EKKFLSCKKKLAEYGGRRRQGGRPPSHSVCLRQRRGHPRRRWMWPEKCATKSPNWCSIYFFCQERRVGAKLFSRARRWAPEAVGCALASLRSSLLKFAGRSALWTATYALPVCINNLP